MRKICTFRSVTGQGRPRRTVTAETDIYSLRVFSLNASADIRSDGRFSVYTYFRPRRPFSFIISL